MTESMSFFHFLIDNSKLISNILNFRKCLAELKKMAQFGTDQLDNLLPTVSLALIMTLLNFDIDK